MHAYAAPTLNNMTADVQKLRAQINDMHGQLQVSMNDQRKQHAEGSEMARMGADILGLLDGLAIAVQDLEQRLAASNVDPSGGA